jgi:hypothetical protein
MEMISEKAIGERLGDGINVLEVQIHEMFVIAFLNENILAVVAAIVNVVTRVVE